MPVLLVIEDDEAQRDVAVFALRQAGHTVHEACDGFAGLKLARELRPEAIVCDVVMPGMNGYEVVEEVRKDAMLAHTPFILLTAMAERQDMRHGMTAGADDYLTKPYRADELRDAVAAVIERRLSQQEAFLQSLGGMVEGALKAQKEHLGQRYEKMLASQMSARWERQADAAGDLHFGRAVLLQADLLGPAVQGAQAPQDLAERVRLAHQQARDSLYVFGAEHVLPYGSDVLGVFAAGADTVAVEVRAARAAFALARMASGGLPGACGLHVGPVSLVAVHDALHGVNGHSVVPGSTLAGVAAMRSHARSAGWRVAASSEVAAGLRGHVSLGRNAATPHGESAIELLALAQG